MGRYLVQIVDTAAYMILYVPTWLVWNLVAKHIVHIVSILSAQEEYKERRESFLRDIDLSTLKLMLCHAYYNSLVLEYQQERLTCGQSV